MEDGAISDLPVMLTVRGKRCVVVGAGAVGARRARLLSEAGAKVVVIAPQVADSARLEGVEIHERAFEPSDLDGALLVIAATNSREVNEAVGYAAAQRGVLCNRTDDAAQGGLTFMSSHRNGPLTVAVHSGGASAAAAGHIRDGLVAQLDQDWGPLLSMARPIRERIKQLVVEPGKRALLLHRLTDDRAMHKLKTAGKSGLLAHYDDMMKDLH